MPAKTSKGLSYSELINKFSKLPGIPKDKELIDINKLKKLKKDEERIGAINWDTTFDQILKEILCIHFSREDKNVTKLFEPSIGGPLVSLTHKARLLYAMGLIDAEALKDLEDIHKIRNEFAHSIKADFSDTKVLKHIKNLSTSKGHKVKGTDASIYFNSAIAKCIEHIKVALQQEEYRQATLKSGKKSVQE